MRLLLALVVIFALVVGAGVWSNRMLEASTGILLKKIDAVAQKVDGKDWEGARDKTDGLEKTWKDKGSWWPLLLDHQEMDNIDFSLARAKEYIAARDHTLSLGQLSELREMVRHIPEKESVSLKNIL